MISLDDIRDASARAGLPGIDLPGIDLVAGVDRVAAMAREAAYVGVGTVIVTLRKADARRREVTDEVTAGVRRLVDMVA